MAGTSRKRQTYLPHKRAGGVLSAFTLPIAPPKTVCGRESFCLHDLRVVDVTGVATDVSSLPKIGVYASVRGSTTRQATQSKATKTAKTGDV